MYGFVHNLSGVEAVVIVYLFLFVFRIFDNKMNKKKKKNHRNAYLSIVKFCFDSLLFYCRCDIPI